MIRVQTGVQTEVVLIESKRSNGMTRAVANPTRDIFGTLLVQSRRVHKQTI